MDLNYITVHNFWVRIISFLKNVKMCLRKCQFQQNFKAAELFSIFIITRNIYLAPNSHIRVISEGSCDAENWIENILNCSQYYCFTAF